MPSHSHHHNHGLFSDNYLSRHLPELVGADLAAAQAAQERLRGIYARGVPLVQGAREGVCEERLIRPAMRALGFELDPQPPLPTVESSFTPDYALFASEEDLAAVAADRGSDDYYARTLAVGEAKSWDRDLGAAAPGETSLRQHPGAQIRRYLLDANVRWGILTNGRLWRIYEREASRAGFRYYEIDLPALLDADVQDFRFFWLLFRRDAFVPDTDGRSFVARVLEESRQYWLDITSRLRDRVYDALEALMTGMIQGSPDLTPDDLPRVHEAALIVLYRLLFAFYAEARRLLPLDNATYRENLSVQTKLSEVARRTDTGGAWARASSGLWQWFRDLSRVINEGDPETGVPEYDGGLFDPAEWPLLADPATVVPDDAMAEVIDRLGRDLDKATGQRAFLDYHELSVRELGSIYEGLLEMRPHWQEDRVELLTDRGERKATGSYYTPEYIVDYIVTNTLDPLLTDAAARVAERRPEIEAEIARRERLVAERGPDDPENAKTLAKIEDLKLDLLEPYFELMVLDPAMGSGHFLVAASEEITEAIITDPAHLSPAGVAGAEDENLFFKRRVVERCLYGVDLNPLAVELAKLSLWLHTVEFGKPLSFLKHHLRTGNSLIGARLQEMHRLPNGPAQPSGQLNLFTQTFMPQATRLLRAFNLIERMPTDTLAQEREKEAAWEEIEERRECFREVANVWLSTYFGNTVDDADYARAVDALGDEPGFALVADEGWFTRAQTLADEHSFFHWELEFPEAFFTEREIKRESERGFDAVVGNPPYGAVLPGQATPLLSSRLLSVGGPADTFALFLEHAAALARHGRCTGHIVPLGWATSDQYASLRRALLDKSPPVNIVVLPYDVFPGAYVDTMIYIGRCGPEHVEHCRTLICPTRTRAERFGQTEEVLHAVADWQGDPARRMRVLLRGGQADLLSQVARISTDLASSFAVTRGITPFSPTEDPTAPLGYLDSIARYDPLQGCQGPVDFGPHLSEHREIHVFRGSRVIVRRIISRGFRIQPTWLSRELVVNKSYLVVHARGQMDARYVTALLGSSLHSARFVWLSAAARRDDYPQLDIATLNEFPVRIIDFSHPTDITLRNEALGRCREGIEAGDYETPFGLARAALAAHAALHGPAGKPDLRADDYWAGEIAWFEAGSEGAPTDLREDFVHDLLAELAQRMIDLNERKHTEKQGFLSWLERTLGCRIDDLSGKSLLADYDDRGKLADFDALCARLCTTANRRKMTADPRGRALQERIAGEYTASIAKLDALNADLAATDALIDRIVYALYGLGPEEIAIIEETLGGDGRAGQG